MAMDGRDSAPEVPDDELVPADDAVIGRAVRRSLLVLAALLIVAGLVFFLRSRPPALGAARTIPAAAPRATETVSRPPDVAFIDVTRESGVDFVHANGAYGKKLLPETMGGGVAFLDYDGDGRPDLLFVNSDRWPETPAQGPRPTLRLYRNEGGFRFRDATAEAGLAVSLYGMGVATGDYDGDGDADLAVTGIGGARLFENRGGKFADATAKAGVGGERGDWSTCAAFLDFDNDGRLDLFVCNYVRWSKEIDLQLDYRLTGIGRAYGPPNNYEGADSRLYKNRGDGTFEEVSAAAGIRVENPATGRPMGKALGVAPVDVDGDGWIDLVVANDTTANFFFHNRSDGTFAEEGAASGLAFDRMGNATGAMGIDSGRYRNDADLAFLVGNFANEMTSAYVTQGDPTLFADEAIGEGVGAPSRLLLKFGLFLFDYDLDGRLDLLSANGHLEEEIAKVDPSQSYRQPAQLFWNAGPDARQTFVQVPTAAIGALAEPLVGRGSAYADVDGDGDLDVVLTQAGGPPRLIRNDQRLGHHWLRVKVVGTKANPDAIGAWVQLTAGGVTQRRQVMPTKSYLSQSELTLTFGLGQAAEVDSLAVTWPGGGEEACSPRPGQAIDRLVVVRQGGGVPLKAPEGSFELRCAAMKENQP